MKRKLIALLLCITLAVSIAACSSTSSQPDGKPQGESGTGKTPAASDELPILGAGIYSASDNFNTYIGKGIMSAAKGVFQTNIEDGQNDQSTQNNQI